jgi:hypothetical protein
MKDELKQLNALLGYWLEHNEEHAGEFREWADKVPVSQKEVADLLRQAVSKMTESNGYLKKAKDLLEKR